VRSIIKKRIHRHMEKYKIMEKSLYSLEIMAHKFVASFFVRISTHVAEADPVDTVYLHTSKLLVKSLPYINQVVTK